MSVKGKTCLVTGAGRGMGKAIGLSLAKDGANVVFADINTVEAEGAANEAKKSGAKALGLHVDVGDRLRQPGQQLVPRLTEQHGLGRSPVDDRRGRATLRYHAAYLALL